MRRSGIQEIESHLIPSDDSVSSDRRARADKFLCRLPDMIPKAAPDQPIHRHDRNFFKKLGTLKIAAIWKAVTRQERATSKQLKGRDLCTS